jgi:phosphotransferase system IIB component
MIQYVKRQHLDVSKYDFCIENSTQSRIYAFSWYLDIVADHWDVLVLDDYEAVMPIPWKKKYGIKYVVQPYFCQQLGIFSKEKISKELVLDFIQNIPNKFFRISLQLNAENNIDSEKLVKKNNYVLALNKTSEALIAGFSNNRKRDLKKAIASSLIIDEDISVKEFFKFYLLNDKYYNKHNSIKNVLENILQIKNGSLKLFGIRSNGVLISCVLLLDDMKRVTYLVPVHNNLSKKNGAMTLLITSIIKKHQNSQYILDFEGSMVNGVASFYKSFGAKISQYQQLKYNNLPYLLKLFKR